MSHFSLCRTGHRRIALLSLLSMFILINQSMILLQPALATTRFMVSGNTGMLSRSRAQSRFNQHTFSFPHPIINRPIIFVHGINQNADDLGVTAFKPIYIELQHFGPMQTFQYVDDQAFAQNPHGLLPDYSCRLPHKYAQYHYTQCSSQSSVMENASELDKAIRQLYNSSHHKVALIGYSMGAAIIRTALAGCPSNVTCQWELGSNIGQMVDDVFFINGAQQGSWWLQQASGLNKESAVVAVLNTPGFKFGLTSLVIHPLLHLDENRPAEHDLTPQSNNISLHNSVAPPGNIHYFNFYGDIHFSLQVNILGWHLKTDLLDAGDMVLLPGTDDPKDAPYWGGARFCYQCANHNASKPDAGTSYAEWPLTVDRQIDVTTLLTCSILQMQRCVLNSLFDTFFKPLPQMHTNIPSTSSLDGTTIQVADTTGMSSSKTTSIAHEIALQLQAMPRTLDTSCPAPGTSRAAVTAPLVLGTDQNLVYSDNAVYGNPSGTLKRYDVTTGKATIIVQLANSPIGATQISADGQWVLFTSSVNGEAAIQMVRMDGRGLQTLYCTPTNSDSFRFPSDALPSLAWSPDQTLAMFVQQTTSYNPGGPSYLLNLAAGTVQQELAPDPNSNTSYSPDVWIDNTHVTLHGPQGIYVLNTQNGANQQSSNLQLIVQNSASCFDSDISSDHTHFFLARCATDPSSNQDGPPSSISVILVTGGSEHSIFTSQVLTVTSIRVLSKTSLLLGIQVANGGDTSQNGLYTMQIDGTGLTKVVGTDVINQSLPQSMRNLGFTIDQSLLPPPVVSRDGNKYALYFNAGCGMHCYMNTILVGSISGGALTNAASLGDETLSIVGWTEM